MKDGRHNCSIHGLTDDTYKWVRRRTGKPDKIETQCRRCHRDRTDGRYVPSGRFLLWADDNYEYRFLRDMGMTPQDIATKFGVRWESFQRTLWRRVGGKANW